MSKFKIKLKITGFELEVEGSREDVAALSQSVSDQMSGMLQPAGMVVDGRAREVAAVEQAPIKQIGSRTRRRRSATGSPHTDNEPGVVVELKHDVESYGIPSQAWKTAQKALWLLFVLEKSGFAAASTKTLVDTFNRHFKQSGTITTSNVTRDLGRLKVSEKPAPVGEDSSKSPSEWFLTTDGKQRAEGLVKEATAS